MGRIRDLKIAARPVVLRSILRPSSGPSGFCFPITAETRNLKPAFTGIYQPPSMESATSCGTRSSARTLSSDGFNNPLSFNFRNARCFLFLAASSRCPRFVSGHGLRGQQTGRHGACHQTLFPFWLRTSRVFQPGLPSNMPTDRSAHSEVMSGQRPQVSGINGLTSSSGISTVSSPKSTTRTLAGGGGISIPLIRDMSNRSARKALKPSLVQTPVAEKSDR